jgi:hypothetical protein
VTLEVRIEGAAAFHQAAAKMRAAGRRSLEQEMGRALEASTKPVERSVRKEYTGLPSRGGYSGEFSKSLRIKLDKRTGARTARITMRAYADGTKERRDIRRLEAGQLRHPVYGRRRRGGSVNPWATTSIKGGYFRRGTDDAADGVRREMIRVVREYADKMV